jgi:hypothetical protein
MILLVIHYYWQEISYLSSNPVQNSEKISLAKKKLQDADDFSISQILFESIFKSKPIFQLSQLEAIAWRF